jgi:hypothetical protein
MDDLRREIRAPEDRPMVSPAAFTSALFRAPTRLGALALLGLLAAPALAHAQSAPDVAGGWELSAAGSNRACRIVLRSDPAGEERTIGMPAGCRRALPILNAVGGWKAPTEGVVELGDATGAPVLQFAPTGHKIFTARGPQGETYELIAAPDPEQEGLVRKTYVPALDENDMMARTRPRAAPGFAQATPGLAPGGFRPVAPGPAPAVTTPADSAPPSSLQRRQAPAQRAPAAAGAQTTASAPTGTVRVSDLAGRFVVLREMTKDTGCMLTLDDRGRGPRGTYRAVLAPACRDQGIVIFDPVGWQIDRNRLALTARKGHLAHFERMPDGTWQKDPKEGGKPLGFRKM